MKSIISRALRCTKGATALEYGLMAALIGIACVGAFQNFAAGENSVWNYVENTIVSVM